MIRLLLNLIANLVELLGGIGAPPDDIELTPPRTTFGIAPVALTSHCHRPTLMGMQQMTLCIEELTLDSIVETAIA